jgi:hypothetical protein
MNQLSHPSNPSFDLPMSAERDLLSSLLSAEPPYPWEPLGPDGETYLDRLAAEFDDPSIDEAITSGWDSFSAQIEAQWDNVNPASPNLTVVDTLLNALKAQFHERMPEASLDSIAASAARLVQSGQPIAEQLVETVQAILPGWDRGDLTILARPLAYSLRDGRGEILDLTLRSAPQAEWATLSEIEKARLSLAIASVALDLARQNN